MKITKKYLKEIIKEELQREGLLDKFFSKKAFSPNEVQAHNIQKHLTNNKFLVKGSEGNLKRMVTLLGMTNADSQLQRFKNGFKPTSPYANMIRDFLQFFPIASSGEARKFLASEITKKVNQLEGKPQ